MLSEIINANIEVHTKMANAYNDEPHFKIENQEKVKKRLQKLQQECNAKNILDIGCGTGFMLNLANDSFDNIYGIDTTQAMLDKVDISSGKIKLYNAIAEKLPFEDNKFDMLTSYAFIHHLEDYSIVLKEALRVLKDDGLYYIDLDPNKYFWEGMNKLEETKNDEEYSDILNKEINAVLHTDEQVMKDFGIEPDVFNNAEYTKSILGGIDPEEFSNLALELGYKEARYEYDWFLGQGTIMHQHSFDEADKIDKYLKSILPLSRHLYKYVTIVLKK